MKLVLKSIGHIFIYWWLNFITWSVRTGVNILNKNAQIISAENQHGHWRNRSTSTVFFFAERNASRKCLDNSPFARHFPWNFFVDFTWTPCTVGTGPEDIACLPRTKYSMASVRRFGHYLPSRVGPILRGGHGQKAEALNSPSTETKHGVCVRASRISPIKQLTVGRRWRTAGRVRRGG